ncbi:MAG: hypothetical protein A3H27_15610 [Acidobacteria bacterium RIFCSPLOWO2_02_FULL_59_13]|nr:MAG: hypothetical protein A3H27_15610 [Acidobacteria bacterium RIFCSPLOWO2_02_FULL_59_13]
MKKVRNRPARVCAGSVPGQAPPGSPLLRPRLGGYPLHVRPVDRAAAARVAMMCAELERAKENPAEAGL